MTDYNPRNWYWIVGGEESHLWSSAAAAYVPQTDKTFSAWFNAGNYPTRIASEAELRDVLAQQFAGGWPGLSARADGQAALDKSDVTVLRCVEAGVALPSEWVTYRGRLRDIIAGNAGGPLPTRPDYPAGT